jgi:GTP-binding protein EngB required for normal cell division
MTSLNESQTQSLLLGCLDIDRRMAEMAALVAQAQDPSPFSAYTNDLSPTEVKVVQDYLARVRETMLAWLKGQGIPVEVRRSSLRWTFQVHLTALQVVVAEMGPEKLRGYGPLDEAGRAAVVQLRQDLDRLFNRPGTYLRQGLGRDLQGRLARLDAAPAQVGTLTLLDQVITRWGLVEFRPLLDQLVSRLEAPRFEIAVFGRVSSGKSSLLNHLAGQDVLPVGVTPITAVPTRLVRGDRPAAVISFAEVKTRTAPVAELRDYASEEGNPGNRKHVTGILVQLPAPRLREGVVLVDTPGIGSLARAGSTETFAYLPRCDLGVVLIDAASTLTPDDLGLLQALYEAAVPAQVVLSKADLLGPADRQRAADYVREQLRRELNLDLPVHPVSTVGADEALLTRWFGQEIEPLLVRHRALVEMSLGRKAAHLRESVAAALETLLARRKRASAPDGRARADGEVLPRLLEEADAAVRQAQARCREWPAGRPMLVERTLDRAAQALVQPPDALEAAGDGPALAAVRDVLTERDCAARQLVTDLCQALARALDLLGPEAPLPSADPGPIRDFALRDLPPLDLAPLREKLPRGRPWWAAALPRLALGIMRRTLDRGPGPALREAVELHDRQLYAWLKTRLAQLVEVYEAQAEVFRGRLRPHGDTAAAPNGDDLAADLQKLRQGEMAGPEAPVGSAAT